MNDFKAFLGTIEKDEHRLILQGVLDDLSLAFPFLEKEVKWNQPMFVDHGSFIIAFSVSKQHFSVALEEPPLEAFKKDIKDAGYGLSKKLFRIKWTDHIDLPLLKKMMAFAIEDRKDSQTFWRKA